MFDYERIEKDNTIRITGMRGNASQVYVPDMLDGHAVTEIGPYAFSGSRITLLGTGDIGQTAAVRLRSFAPASLTGVNRSGKNPGDLFDTVVKVSDIIPYAVHSVKIQAMEKIGLFRNR